MEGLWDEAGEALEQVCKPQMVFRMKLPQPVPPLSLLRRQAELTLKQRKPPPAVHSAGGGSLSVSIGRVQSLEHAQGHDKAGLTLGAALRRKRLFPVPTIMLWRAIKYTLLLAQEAMELSSAKEPDCPSTLPPSLR